MVPCILTSVAGGQDMADSTVTTARRGAHLLAMAAVLGLLFAAPAPADPDKPKPAAAPSGYLIPEQRPEVSAILGPPPAAGSGTKTGDVATYQATRALEGTPRWSLAQKDAVYGPAPMMAAFSCALGVSLTPDTAPVLFHLLSRVVSDSDESERVAKKAYQRPRPFVENGGNICVAPEDWLKKSYSYPSGHSTFGWTTALIMAEIAPDRGAAVLARGRAYGESRVVCGVHYESDVQSGRLAASAVFDVLQSSPEFRADLDLAKAELAKLRAAAAGGLDAGECKIEAEASSHPVW